MRRRTIWLLMVALAAVGGGIVIWVGSPEPPAWKTCSAPLAHEVPTAEAVDPPVAVGFEPIAELNQPTAAASLSDGTLLVTLKEHGIVEIAPDGTVSPGVDLTDDLSFESERGVLGIAVQPDGTAAFVAYTAADGAFTLERIGLPLDSSHPTRDVLLSYPNDHPHHNGGHVAFGPDGMLYVGLGDGGDDDYQGDPEDDAQSLDTLFGSILRLDVTTAPGRYEVPNDNPFVTDPASRPEIWAYGLRNPWRFSFETSTGDLWVADVGHGCWEEINRVPSDHAGANFGWNRYEGAHEFRPTNEAPTDLIWPLYQYRHVPGPLQAQIEGDRPLCAIVGGPVYAGTGLAGLDGWYLYADYCASVLYALTSSSPDVVEVAELTESPTPIVGLALDAEGEVLALTTNAILRLVPLGSSRPTTPISLAP